MKFQKDDKVKFSELGREFQGTIIVGLHDEELSDEPYYLVNVSGRQVVKNESELEAA
jgi:hypothetical protein